MARALVFYNQGTGTVEIAVDPEKRDERTRIYVGFAYPYQGALVVAADFLHGLIAYGQPKLEGFKRTAEVMLSRDPHCVEGLEMQAHNLTLEKELEGLQELRAILCAEITDQAQLAQEPMPLEKMRKIGYYLPSWFKCQMRCS